MFEQLRQLWRDAIGALRGGIATLIGWIGIAVRQAWSWLWTGVRTLGGWIAIPVRALWRWLKGANIWVKVAAAVIVVPIVLGYLHFYWNAIFIRGADLAYPDRLGIEERAAAPGRPAAPAIEGGDARCGTSFIVAATVHLLDLEVNRNLWIPSNPFYKLGFFFIPWQNTPFLDNKAAFQRGTHQAVARTAIELADTLGRVRGTSEIDPDLSLARGNIQFDQATWYSTRSALVRSAPPPRRRATIAAPGGFSSPISSASPPARRVSTSGPTTSSSSSTASPPTSARSPRS